MVAGQEHVGNQRTVPLGGPGVHGRTDRAFFRERLVDQTVTVSEHAFKTPDGGIRERRRNELTSGEHEVAYRDTLRRQLGPNSLINPAVATADDRQVRPSGDFFHISLSDRTPGRLSEDYTSLPFHPPRRDSVDLLQSAGDDIHPHHHPGPAPVGHVVYPAVRGVVPEIEAPVADNAPLYRPSHNPDAQSRVHRGGENAEDVDAPHEITPPAGG